MTRLTDADLRAVVEAKRQHASNAAAARSLGIARSTFNSRYDAALREGFHLSEGAREVVQSVNLSPREAKGGWIHNYDEDGKKIGATRWAVEDVAEQDTIDRIREALEGLTPAQPTPAPQFSDSDLATVYPIADRHQGMLAWKREVGESYDNKIAASRMKEWMGRCVATSPRSQTAIILDIGDGEHIDDQTNVTPKSKHPLDADGRVFMTLETSVETLAYCVDIALEKHERVIVRILPGNHNPTLYLATMFALAERYRNEPRAEVQKVPGEFFVETFGKCLIAATHGDKIKADRMVMFLADEFADKWGKTRHRFLWTGHHHNHKAEDIGGVAWEQLRPVTSRDAYAYSHAFSGRSQLQAVTLHRELGEVQRVKVCS